MAVDVKLDKIQDDVANIKVELAETKVIVKSVVNSTERLYDKLESHNNSLDQYNEQLVLHIQGVKEAHRRNDLLERNINNLTAKITKLDSVYILGRGLLALIGILGVLISIFYQLRHLA